MPLRLVNEAVEDVVDGLPDERPVHHELTIDAMQDGLQVVPLPRILGVEELQELEHKRVIDVLLPNLRVHLIRNDVA